MYMPSKLASGQYNTVSILEVQPAGQTLNNGSSTLTGPVGYALNLQGTIYTANSTYDIIFANQVIASGNTYPDGYYVNANFSVPAVPTGTYALRLRDVVLNTNSTEDDFQVTTSYIINAVPSQIQEGNSVVINVGVTGGVASTPYFANVSVVLPSPLSTQYSEIVSLGTTNQAGSASAQVTYPGTAFQPSGSLTDYSGTYSINFNQSLAQSQFSAGFLDSSTYHRGQTVTIRAIGYTSGETATLSVTSASGGSNLDSETVTAGTDGVISKAWVVPSNAALGSYNVTIAPQGTAKGIEDSQTFSINGYAVQVKTVNLAGDVVPQIQVQAIDGATNTPYNNTSGANGIANLNLESGTDVLNAFKNGVNIGTTNITITGNATFTFQCQLTNLKIEVQNQNSVAMPFVDLAITYQYQPAAGGSQTGSASGQTDSTGIFVLNSTLTGISYTINASLYNNVFNSGNNTFNNIPAQPVTTVVITCPNETVSLNVVGYNQEAIPNTRIELVELTNGVFYAATTDTSGSVTSQVSFGMYRARFYKDNILINQTDISVFSNTQTRIVCSLYGIQVSVKIVDFFGSPISNANVTLNGPATERFSAMTKGDGTATFSNVVGGDMQVVAFASSGQNDYQSVALTVNQPTTVQLKIDRYVAFGSLLIPVSSLIAVLVILLGIILLAIVEVYRRKRVKHTTGS
jgi:membrane-bound inhibitor of C-type lysozyme